MILSYLYFFMQCTNCKKIFDQDDFKNEKNNIYYLRCINCRKYNDPLKTKLYYEKTKKNNVINCNCGSSYIAFREYHIMRHMNSQKHLLNIHKK